MDEDLRMDSNPLNPPEEDSVHNQRLSEMLPTRGNIRPEIIELIESDLELYEKVALVFLLYDSVPVALQRLNVAEAANRGGMLSSPGLLSDWAHCCNSANWESKFLEAVSIIQNYYVIEKLGYTKVEVTERYLPNTPDVSVSIHLMRKALYDMCEKLTKEEGKQLVRLVEVDRKVQSAASDFLEVHILNWMDDKYITVGPDGPVNVSNLTKHLKIMEKHGLKDCLEAIASRCERNRDDISDDSEPPEHARSTTDCNRRTQTPGSSESSRNSQSFSGETSHDIGCYHMDPWNIGICVIINQKNFYRESDESLKDYLSPDELEDRIGTDIDRDLLSEAFGNFGFTISTWTNLSHKKLLCCIDTATHNLVQDKYSCFVLCILSHGVEDAVYGVNSISVSIADINDRMNGKYCPKLIKKPKILIIQACQGRKLSDAVPVPNENLTHDGPSWSSPLSDTLISMSTVPGHVSFRHKLTGSWFIQNLCHILLTSTKEVNFVDVLTGVNNQVGNKSALVNQTHKAMQPQFRSTLTKRLCFPINMAARKKAMLMKIKRYIFDNLADEYLRREFRQNYDTVLNNTPGSSYT